MHQFTGLKLPIKLLILFIVIISNTSIAQVTDKSTEIINNYIEAIGGNKKIKKLKSYQSKGFWKIPGQSLNYETYLKYHDKLAIVTQSASYYEKTVFDNGKSTSIINDSSFVNDNQTALKAYELDCYILPLTHKDETIKYSEFKGEVVKDNILCEELHVIFKNGTEWLVQFDKKSHLIYNIRTTTGMDITYKKHESIDGILFPIEFDFDLKNSGQFQLILNSIKINQIIPEKTFEL